MTIPTNLPPPSSDKPLIPAQQKEGETSKEALADKTEKVKASIAAKDTPSTPAVVIPAPPPTLSAISDEHQEAQAQLTSTALEGLSKSKEQAQLPSSAGVASTVSTTAAASALTSAAASTAAAAPKEFKFPLIITEKREKFLKELSPEKMATILKFEEEMKAIPDIGIKELIQITFSYFDEDEQETIYQYLRAVLPENYLNIEGSLKRVPSHHQALVYAYQFLEEKVFNNSLLRVLPPDQAKELADKNPKELQKAVQTHFLNAKKPSTIEEMDAEINMFKEFNKLIQELQTPQGLNTAKFKALKFLLHNGLSINFTKVNWDQAFSNILALILNQPDIHTKRSALDIFSLLLQKFNFTEARNLQTEAEKNELLAGAFLGSLDDVYLGKGAWKTGDVFYVNFFLNHVSLDHISEHHWKILFNRLLPFINIYPGQPNTQINHQESIEIFCDLLKQYATSIEDFEILKNVLFRDLTISNYPPQIIKTLFEIGYEFPKETIVSAIVHLPFEQWKNFENTNLALILKDETSQKKSEYCKLARTELEKSLFRSFKRTVGDWYFMATPEYLNSRREIFTDIFNRMQRLAAWSRIEQIIMGKKDALDGNLFSADFHKEMFAQISQARSSSSPSVSISELLKESAASTPSASVEVVHPNASEKFSNPNTEQLVLQYYTIIEKMLLNESIKDLESYLKE